MKQESGSPVETPKRASKLLGALSKRFSKLGVKSKDSARAVHTPPIQSGSMPGVGHAHPPPVDTTGHAAPALQSDGASELSSLEALPEEILSDIVRMLWRDPQPEGYFSEYEYRGDKVYALLAQPDLAALMRVSPRLQSIAGPILYTDIIASNIPSLFFNAVKGPAGFAASSARKRGLLGHCRSLVLESHKAFSDRGTSARIEEEGKSLTKALELAVASGGFDELFPRLERFSTSIYTTKERQNFVYGTLWQDHSADPLYAAWYALMETCSAPIRCSDIMRRYPLPGPAPDPLYAKPQPIERMKPANMQPDPVDYVHLHFASRPLEIRYNVKTVYLVSVGTYLGLDPRMHLLTWLTNHAHDILRRTQQSPPDTRPGDKRDLYLDVEFRIPIVFVREFVTDIEALFAGNLQRIRDWYVKEGGQSKRVRDTWTIRVMDIVRCPACRTVKSRYEAGMEDRESFVKAMTYEHPK